MGILKYHISAHFNVLCPPNDGTLKSVQLKYDQLSIVDEQQIWYIVMC